MKKYLIILFVSVFLSVPMTSRSQEVKKPISEEKEAVIQAQSSESQSVVNLPSRDVEDIPIPSPMKLDKSSTVLFEAKGIKVGVLTYFGNVDGYSLAEAIKNNLLGEKWRLINMLIYKNTINLNFTKNDKTCNVFIEEGWFKTRLEIRVGIISGN